MRKKQKKKAGKTNELAFEIEEVICGIDDISVSKGDSISTPQEIIDDPEIVKKRLRTLKKKLKQIEELEEGIDNGDIKPDKEQLKKLSRKKELEKEIEELCQKM